jgi:transcriptional regulator with XRE-family HTH domain
MTDLRKRFGQLVAAHRRRQGLTQEGLAEAADLSPEMVAKIETGKSGARFPVIERIADALDVDPAELFTTQLPPGLFRKVRSPRSRCASRRCRRATFGGSVASSMQS